MSTTDSMERNSSELTERHSEETRAETTGEHGDTMATYGLSQLSCSTANNEDFYVVPQHSDEETQNGKISAIKRITSDMGSGVAEDHSLRSAAAQTSMFINTELPPPPFMYGFGGRSGVPYKPFVFREINRIPNAHLRPVTAPQYASIDMHKAGDRRNGSLRTTSLVSQNITVGGDSRNLKQAQHKDQNNNSAAESTGLRAAARSNSINSRGLHLSPGSPSQANLMKGIYPLMHVSPNGVISLVISDSVVIETALDKSIRIVAHNHFAMTMNARGLASAIQHPRANIVHADSNISAKFVAANDKYAVFNSDAILFAAGHCKRGYLMNSNERDKGIKEIPLELEKFAGCNLDQDYTLRVFYNEIPDVGAQCLDLCYEVVRKASFEYHENGTLSLSVNGMVIICRADGELQIDARPRLIICNPRTGTLLMRCPTIDMAIEADEKAYIKRGMKRVHVSRSGMVVSDGNCVASLDQCGNPISCT